MELNRDAPVQTESRKLQHKIRCKSLEENEKVERFLGKHLNNHFTDTRKWIDENGVEQLVATRITTFDALDGEGEVLFINEFAGD